MGSGGVLRQCGDAPTRIPVSKSHKTPSRYPIRAVSRLTGIGIDTLRAWERRHDAVTPVRDERGRMYSDADVARLRLLRDVPEWCPDQASRWWETNLPGLTLAPSDGDATPADTHVVTAAVGSRIPA